MKFLRSLALALMTIEGVIQSISGDTLTVKTADERVSIVDMADVARDQARIALGNTVTITGRFSPEDNKFRASSVEPADIGSASPALDGRRRQ